MGKMMLQEIENPESPVDDDQQLEFLMSKYGVVPAAPVPADTDMEDSVAETEL